LTKEWIKVKKGYNHVFIVIALFVAILLSWQYFELTRSGEYSRAFSDTVIADDGLNISISGLAYPEFLYKVNGQDYLTGGFWFGFCPDNSSILPAKAYRVEFGDLEEYCRSSNDTYYFSKICYSEENPKNLFWINGAVVRDSVVFSVKSVSEDNRFLAYRAFLKKEEGNIRIFYSPSAMEYIKNISVLLIFFGILLYCMSSFKKNRNS
jgi:hypothetical protein